MGPPLWGTPIVGSQFSLNTGPSGRINFALNTLRVIHDPINWQSASGILFYTNVSSIFSGDALSNALAIPSPTT